MADDFNWENSQFVHQSTLWQTYQQSHLAANRDDVAKEIMDFVH
jgi:hypothetical protein